MNTETEPRPTNVVAAIAAVMAEIGGIDKKTQAQRAREKGERPTEQGVSYAYRGIDQIASAAQPLFGRYGVIMVPTILSCDVTEITVNGKPWSDTTVTVNWSIYGPGGIEDAIEARTTGQGRDNSDKGINKAMTGAFKNLLLRLLCIGDQKDDTDGATYERDNTAQRPQTAKETEPPPADPADLAAAVALFEQLPHLDDANKLKAKDAAKKHGAKLLVADIANNKQFRAEIALICAEDPSAPFTNENEGESNAG